MSTEPSDIWTPDGPPCTVVSISGELVPVHPTPLDVAVAETTGVSLPQCYRIRPTDDETAPR
jgi:hypothetical protein